ncbi:unnamed protein product [Caenorhabditis bovis]|uniref:Peptidase C1A papain C-terminal domain-containing protein n=1 Tax=Caenorhabditis bovis TaxID=2654633 RepID=A0A8S1EM33_9PELO|nr:unnamed protein product [Caenorhabditis bovis]
MISFCSTSNMKCFIIAAALCAATLAFVVPDEVAKREMLTGAELVDYVNSVQKDFVLEHSDLTVEDIMPKLMHPKYAAAHSDELLATAVTEEAASIPASFDARAKWPHCSSIKLVRDQTNCGSCWAFSTAETMSDRTCIASNGAQQPILAPEDALSCCGSTCGYGCEGGYPIEALRYWGKTGVVTGGDYHGSGCLPYTIAPCSGNCKEASTPKCVKSCQSGYSKSFSADKHFGKSAYAVAKTVSAIQTEIMNNGPVTGAFSVYEDFYKYKSGVYHHTAGKLLGGHAIKIIGWGTEGGKNYWLVANSWGSSWGESGFFKILRGTNECGIEHAVVAGLAKV